ncbi:MAG: hypothetical protein KC420_01785 [Myxococcales bacterium]|nr:hypothetical protein [Myxococcales bacterium]MCB9567840.1 hypothetical protein [Myxococcales bacterium]MCB9700285.1 hypothetical protein [Myxococcales bacterium]
MKSLTITSIIAAAALLTACDEGDNTDLRKGKPTVNSGSYNLHLSNKLRYDALKPGADAEAGRARFGVAADLVNGDDSGALFTGASQVFQGEVTSNGRTCFSCHRGADEDFGLPPPPLSASIPADDPIFTGINADAQGDPDASNNLENHGLFKYRFGRFNPARTQDDPFRTSFAWRKSPTLVNAAFNHGFLNDGRSRVMFETARGAVFSHTQDSDDRFDDLFSNKDGADIEAFVFSILSDPVLAALRDPNDPMHDTLASDPYYTVELSTKAQKRGRKVFDENCFVCHDTPNVFNNRSNVEALGAGDRPENFPAFAPSTGRTFNIGVSERNKHNLRFTQDLGGGNFAPIVIPLAKENGERVDYVIDMDIGLAGTTARVEDLGRFKVPQLRNLAKNGPYFHDNSADTIEEVVDYFLSSDYKNSHDGSKHPIKMSAKERADLIEFLKVL